jgi:YHS domain-containing protein
MKKIDVFIMIATSLISAAAMADGSKVKLGGYCPVAYVGAQKALFGNPDFNSEYEGATYYFINKGAKETFDKEPAKFANGVKYDSWCATGISLGKKLATDPKQFSVVEGKVYLFSSAEAKAMFDKDQVVMLKKAEANWAKLSSR